MASVIHGFIYNKDAFDKLGIAVPATEAEFFAALDKIKADGTYIPLAMGTKDQWEAATMGYQNIGPNYWKGEEGRLALIKGEQKLTDPQWVEPYATLAKWKPYLGDGFEAQTYPDSQNLFTLGRAAIYPAGSWEISGFNTQAQFKMGAFPPPVKKAGDTCYISDHTDIAHRPERQEPECRMRPRPSCPGSPRRNSPTIYANALPGFFSLSSTPVKMEDPLAQEFVSWREKCKPTIRSTYQILSRGTPNLENETWVEVGQRDQRHRDAGSCRRRSCRRASTAGTSRQSEACRRHDFAPRLTSNVRRGPVASFRRATIAVCRRVTLTSAGKDPDLVDRSCCASAAVLSVKRLATGRGRAWPMAKQRSRRQASTGADALQRSTA